MAVYDEWEAANAKVAGLSLDALTHTELLELRTGERLWCAPSPRWTIGSSTGWPPRPIPKRCAAPRWPMSWPRNWGCPKNKRDDGESSRPSCSVRGER